MVISETLILMECVFSYVMIYWYIIVFLHLCSQGCIEPT